jgi:hypothetical protein
MVETKVQEQILANIKHAKALKAKQIQEKEKRDPNFKYQMTVKEDGTKVWSC